MISCVPLAGPDLTTNSSRVISGSKIAVGSVANMSLKLLNTYPRNVSKNINPGADVAFDSDSFAAI